MYTLASCNCPATAMTHEPLIDVLLRINQGRLRLRLVVMPTWRSLRQPFRDYDGKDSYDSARVTAWTDNTPSDPKLFSAIWLCAKGITYEDIVHEAVHAACAYYTRLEGRPVFKDSGLDIEDEQLAYPTGRIVARIIRELRKAGIEIKDR